MDTDGIKLSNADFAKLAAIRMVGGDLEVSLLTNGAELGKARGRFVIRNGKVVNENAICFGPFTQAYKIEGFVIRMVDCDALCFTEHYPTRNQKTIWVGDTVQFSKGDLNLCFDFL